MAHGEVKHDYHLLPPSPWPLVGSASATIMAIGLVLFVILVFVVTVVRLGGSVGSRPF